MSKSLWKCFLFLILVTLILLNLVRASKDLLVHLKYQLPFSSITKHEHERQKKGTSTSTVTPSMQIRASYDETPSTFWIPYSTKRHKRDIYTYLRKSTASPETRFFWFTKILHPVVSRCLLG